MELTLGRQVVRTTIAKGRQDGRLRPSGRGDTLVSFERSKNVNRDRPRIFGELRGVIRRERVRQASTNGGAVDDDEQLRDSMIESRLSHEVSLQI
jgi:hypothetical protein